MPSVLPDAASPLRSALTGTGKENDEEPRESTFLSVVRPAVEHDQPRLETAAGPEINKKKHVGKGAVENGS